MPVDAAGALGPSPDSPTYPRRNNFDLLRLVLAYAVVVYHVSYLTGHDRFVPGSVAGVAVAGFFVISGFLLTWSLARRSDLETYATKRLFRIYPLYALVMVAQAVILLAESGGTAAELGGETLRYLAANLTFANFIQPTIGDVLSPLRMNAINGSAWTLKVEIACYVFLPLALLLRRRLGPIFAIISTLVVAGSPLLLPSLLGSGHASVYIGLAGYFLTGSILFYLGARLDRFRNHFLTVAIVGTPLIFLFSGLVTRTPIVAQLVVGLWVYCFAFASRTFTLEYDVSYGAYLLHFPIVQLALLHELLPDNVAAALASVVLVTTLLAWLSFRYIESPMIRLGHGIAREGGSRTNGRAPIR